MDRNTLGKTGLQVSRLSFGASALGGVFRPVEESNGIRAVHAALASGINYFDVAPAYGGTRSETTLGKALRTIPRDSYFLSTKVGKQTDPHDYANNAFDYSAESIRSSLDASSVRLGTEYFDIIHLHDIEYKNDRNADWALAEGLDTLHDLKHEGRIGAIGIGMYSIELWKRVLLNYDIDAALIHNHYCLNDDRLLELLPITDKSNAGVINGSPFASGLLTDRGPADWHPAGTEERAIFAKTADYCRRQGTNISKLALQFAVNEKKIPTTMFSSADAGTVERTVIWATQPLDTELLKKVLDCLTPVHNQQWNY
jgi:L-galactose dehydrogenase